MGLRHNPYLYPFRPYRNKDLPNLPPSPSPSSSVQRPPTPISIIVINNYDEERGEEGEVSWEERKEEPEELNEKEKARKHNEAQKKRQMYREAIQRGAKAGAKKKSDNFEIQSNLSTRFEDVGGYATVKAQLYQILDMYKNYEKYEKHGARIPKGLLLEGSPGNGKTLLARAMAGESGLNFVSVSGSQFQEMYVGVGSSRIRELFQLARENVPCIVFIDEIDALGRRRSGGGERTGGSGDSERDSTLNELLVQLDGFTPNEGVFVMMATNRADMLDPALLRSGRTDKRVCLPLPDETTRREILRIHGKNKQFLGVTEEDMVEDTASCSGAEIENYLNEAILHALLHNRTQIEPIDLNVAWDAIQYGTLSENAIFSHQMKTQIAVHELGHAWLGMASNLTQVRSIRMNWRNPYTPAITRFESSSMDNGLHTREFLINQIMVLLGGRLAEELVYGKDAISTGAKNDLIQAELLSQRMVYEFGIKLEKKKGKWVSSNSFGERAKNKLNNQQNAIMNYAYEEATKRLNTTQALHFIHHFTPILIQRESLNGLDMYSFVAL